MGKPRLIILIRHAQSEGNKNREIHQTIPDHRVELTPEGQQQALEAGRKLRSLIRPDDTLHFFTSPYRRTRETTEGILTSLTSDYPSPSPFPRHTIKVYEEPRLREQDFGNFQPGSADMERMWRERADYGHFFYRIPNGESAADAYDRVSGFNDSLWRRFEENDFASVCILVTHGLMTRVFLMKWYHFSVEYFEDLRNVNHCEFVVMKKNPDNGKFVLQNQLRTWSQLKRERATRGSISLPFNAEPALGDSPIPVRRRWGDCPEGCEHSNHHPRQYTKRPPVRQNTEDLFRDDNEVFSKFCGSATQPIQEHQIAPDSSGPQADDNTTQDQDRAKLLGLSQVQGVDREASQSQEMLKALDTSTLDEGLAASPNHPYSGLRQSFPGGRDGGGSKSGAASMVGSSEDEGEQHSRSTPVPPRSLARALKGEFGDPGSHAMADALGDQSDPELDETDTARGQRQAEEMKKIVDDERRDRNLRRSVY